VPIARGALRGVGLEGNVTSTPPGFRARSSSSRQSQAFLAQINPASGFRVMDAMSTTQQNPTKANEKKGKNKTKTKYPTK
jgi:hypothetical protein